LKEEKTYFLSIANFFSDVDHGAKISFIQGWPVAFLMLIEKQFLF
jgi:hypothetical protein